VQNVVTYDAVIDFENTGMRLFPGMTAYVTMLVATAPNVLKLPNAALRCKPSLEPEEIRALYRKAGIDVVADPGGEAPGSGQAIVWKLRPDDTLEPIEVSLGITDHAFTEVTSVLVGALKEGDPLVTRTLTVQPQGPGQGVGVRR
jgi:HlyD family secretion protein